MKRSVHIVNDSGRGLARDTIVTDAYTGERIRHIRRIEIAPMGIDDMMTASIEVVAPHIDLLCQASITAIMLVAEWIPASRPPLTGEFRIVVLENKEGKRYVGSCWYETKTSTWGGVQDSETVTHWMPYPELPEKE